MIPLDNYDDLRYMNDEEVSEYIAQIFRNKTVIEGIAQAIFGKKISNWKLPKWVLQRLLIWHFKNATTVDKLHNQIRWLVGFNLKQTADFSWDPINPAEFNQPSLLISNHRDIICDPTYVNFAFKKLNIPTTRMAIGDNLNALPDWGFQGLRALGCFMVERAKVNREKILTRQKRLSSYIKHIMEQEKVNVWISHASGRSLDGKDKTNPNILKMLNACNVDESPTDLVKRLNIKVMTISYEYDPTDVTKAKQLLNPNAKRNYARQSMEGILGQKGKVHVNVAALAQKEYKTFKEIAERIDEILKQEYQIFPSAVAARTMIEQSDAILEDYPQFSAAQIETAKQELKRRTMNVKDSDVVQQVLATYAEPCYWVVNANVKP